MIMVETGVDETDGKWYDGLAGEFLEIVMADPALLLRGRQVLQRYSPQVQALIDKKEARLNNADLREINDLLKLVEVRAGVGLRLV